MADKEPLATYSSHPIKRFGVGKFKFQNGILKLFSEEEVKEFENSLDGMPSSERHRIKKVDLAAAEAIVRERLAQQGGATKQTDSTIGERTTNAPKIGTGDLVKDSQPTAESGDATEKPASPFAGLKK